MAMIVHPRDDGEKKFVEGLYKGLKSLRFSRLGYAICELTIKGDGFSLRISPGDLIVLAKDKRESSYLFAVYKEVKENPQKYVSLPDFNYIDIETIALAKKKHKIVEMVNNTLFETNKSISR